VRTGDGATRQHAGTKRSAPFFCYSWLPSPDTLRPVTITTDVLIIGSGVAGLTVALDVAESAQVTVVTKRDRLESATSKAQGGIAVVMDAHDSPEAHARDTMVAGAGLCHEVVVDLCVREGPERLRELM